MPSLKFKIEQIAICPPDHQAARELIQDMFDVGREAYDQVTATGKVFDIKATNVASLSFFYGPFTDNFTEFEILNYETGNNWMDGRSNADPHRVSHFGMHVTDEELIQWRAFFEKRNIGVAQEVETTNHTNSKIPANRRYHYVIFNTHPILGVDIKFIVRQTVL